MGTWDFAQWGLCSNVTPLATNRPKCPSTSCEYFIARDICNLQERLESFSRILCINLFVYFLFCPGFPLRCFFLRFFFSNCLVFQTFWLKSHLKRLGWPIRYWTNSAAELFAASCGVAVSQRPDLGRGESRKMKIEVRADVCFEGPGAPTDSKLFWKSETNSLRHFIGISICSELGPQKVLICWICFN